MGGRGGMLALSSGDELIVEKVGLCRKWMVGRCGIESTACDKISIVQISEN